MGIAKAARDLREGDQLRGAVTPDEGIETTAAASFDASPTGREGGFPDEGIETVRRFCGHCHGKVVKAVSPMRGLRLMVDGPAGFTMES